MLFVVLVKCNLSNKEFQCHKKQVKSMESVDNVMKRYKGLTYCSSQLRHPRGSGLGGTPLYKPYKYVLHQRVGSFRRFGLKTDIHFAHFGLESVMFFKGTTGVYVRIYCFSSKWVRKREKYTNSKWILRNVFCCCSNLCNDDIISWRPGLRKGIHLEARSENGCEKWHF